MIDRTGLPVQGEVSELATLIQCLNATGFNKMLNYRADHRGKMYKRGPLGAAAAMCAHLLDLRMKAPSQSVLPRIDKEADDGRFAKRLSGLQPVQTFNQYEAGAVHPY